MEKQYTFFDLIVDVFNETKNPMTADEIWEKAVEFGFDKKHRLQQLGQDCMLMQKITARKVLLFKFQKDHQVFYLEV